ncbi:MAG TPA: nickel transporter [Actinomycetota bacterium]|jgi:ABC-type nickel/cobalt efflux system permease component RcnA|nr:nickel transporter [Actinomycetota bacterium]
MIALRRLLALGAAVSALILSPAAAHAHPLGNFTVNVYDGLVLSPGRIRVLHVVDMAEIPTFQELRRLPGNGEPSDAELAAWAAGAARRAIQQLSLTVASRPVALRLEDAAAELRPGQGGLPTLRLETTFVGDLPAAGTVAFRDGTYSGRIGWREMTAIGTGGTALRRASVPSVSASNALRAYPNDLRSSPPHVVRAAVSFGPVGAGYSEMGADPVTTATAERTGVSGGGFADLATRPLTPAAVTMGLVLALGFGALHAMGPGHGKTIMAAYLVGSGGAIRQVVGVAAAVAGMHTASVLALGAVILSAERAFPAERIYPWLGLVSGGLAMALGATLLATRLRGRTAHHDHDHSGGVSRPLSRRGLAVLAASGGLLPSPTAIIVLLASIALGRAGFGMALVGAFSLGLAASLALVGVLAVRARMHLAPRLGRLTRLLPLGSASAIAAFGALLMVRAAAQL